MVIRIWLGFPGIAFCERQGLNHLQTIIEDNGGTGGFASYAGFIKEKQTGAFVLTNTYDDFDHIGHDLPGIDSAP